jgi:hypothetical protein
MVNSSKKMGFNQEFCDYSTIWGKRIERISGFKKFVYQNHYASFEVSNFLNFH